MVGVEDVHERRRSRDHEDTCVVQLGDRGLSCDGDDEPDIERPEVDDEVDDTTATCTVRAEDVPSDRAGASTWAV